MSDDDHGDVPPMPQENKGRKKPRSPHYQGNNKGGYGNPPVKSQFNGKAGPGRPSGPASLEAEMRQMLKSNVRFKDGGATSYPRALAIAAREASLKKTTRASEFGFSLFDRFGPKEPLQPQDIVDWSILNEAELVILSSFLNRALGLPPEEIASNPLRVAVETGEGLFRVAKGIDGHLHFERVSDMQGGREDAPTGAFD